MAITIKRKTIIASVSVLLLSLALYILIVIDPLSRFEYVVIQATTDKDTIVSIYTDTGLRSKPNFKNKPVGGAILTTGGDRIIRLPTKNHISPEIKIAVNQKISLTIKSIRMLSHYANSKEFQGKDLLQIVEVDKAVGTIEKSGKGITIHFNKPDGTLRLRGPIRADSVWLSYGIPVIAGFFFFLILTRTRLSSFPALHDIKTRDTTHHIYRKELDGLRGIAALFVLLEHSWFSFLGLGRTGVWIFFLLSGYLLSQPFVLKPSRAVDPNYLSTYMLRRISRIVPMYFVTIILLFGVTGHADKFFTHFLFLQADGYLWTIPQEIYFYLFLPGLAVAMYLLGGLHNLLKILVIGITCIFLLRQPEILPVTIFAYGKSLPLYLGWFLTGILIACINPEDSAFWKNSLNEKHRRLLSYSGLLVFVLLIVFSLPSITTKLTGSNLVFPIDYKGIFGASSAVLMFLILLTPGTILSKILTWTPFRAIGIVGFSFYLLHPIIIDLIRNLTVVYFDKPLPSGPLLFLVSMLCTWMAAAMTYSFIERPFIKRKY